jgi:cobalt/nickel transport protein
MTDRCEGSRLMNNALFLVLAAVSLTAAHFQVIYTPQVETTEKSLQFLLFFTHPFAGEPVMKTGAQEDGSVLGIKELFVVHDGKVRDVKSALREVIFATLRDKGPAQRFCLDQNAGYKAAGDYAVVAVPYPYWEPSEHAYIQQIAKLFVNKGGFTTDWAKRCAKGFAEIVPLVKPYEMVPGSLFRAVVFDTRGKPVPRCAVEIECLNVEIEFSANRIASAGKIINEKYGVATVITDANGVFDYIPLRPGFWGFAAIGAGSDKTWKGKALEQDPVLWIKVAE